MSILASELVQAIRSDLAVFLGDATLSDDLTILVVQRCGTVECGETA
jgi:serine phosphatase RsbU (regulator of sigma subunit)